MGAKVLQTRSVEYAKAKGVTLRVKSSFLPAGQSAGTEVTPEAEIGEKRIVSGVAYVRDQARLSIHGGEGPQAAELLFAALGEADVDVDMIVQARGALGRLRGGVLGGGAGLAARPGRGRSRGASERSRRSL